MTPASTESVSIALIGHGVWGEKIARTLGRVPRASLHTVCDVSEPARQRAKAASPKVRVAACLDEVIEGDQARAVIIATPPASHAELALRAIEAGLDVMVEKPMALCLDQARRLEGAAREAGRVLMVGHILEYHPAVVELRRRIADGEMGEVQVVISERLSSSLSRHEDAWWSLGPHDVSVLRFLTGETPTRVAVSSLAAGPVNVAAARIECGQGSLGLAHFSLVDAQKVRRIVVVGSERVAIFDDLREEQRLSVVDVDDVGTARLADVVGLAREYSPARQSARDVLDGVAPNRWLPLGAGSGIRVEPRAALELEAEHFVSGVLDGRPVQSDATSGREVVAVLVAGQRSLEQGGFAEVALD